MFVSNTSTLVLLAKATCLEKFIEICPVIEIPSQVKSEALFHKESYYAKLIQKLVEQGKIEVVDLKKEELKKITSEFRLDEGEAAAYAMFNPKRHKAILTDDGELIKLCKLQQIPFICAMAIVIRLHEMKKLSREEALRKLQNLYEVGRYSKDLYEEFKAEVE